MNLLAFSEGLQSCLDSSFSMLRNGEAISFVDGTPEPSYYVFVREMQRQDFLATLTEAEEEAVGAGTLVNDEIHERAYAFIHALPDSIAIPEPSVTDGGETILDWSVGSKRFSVLFDSRRLVHYAGLNETSREKAYGELPYEGEQIHPKMLRLISEWTAEPA
jgi:hypothetical protein